MPIFLHVRVHAPYFVLPVELVELEAFEDVVVETAFVVDVASVVAVAPKFVN